MRLARLARMILVPTLAVAFAFGSLMHRPAMALATLPSMDCHPQAIASDEDAHAHTGHHGAPAQQIVFDCPFANLTAHAPVAPEPIVTAVAHAVRYLAPTALLTSVSIESADPPPRAAFA